MVSPWNVGVLARGVRGWVGLMGLGYGVAWSLPVRKGASSSAVTVRSRDRVAGS